MSCCFSATDLEDSLAEIDFILNELNSQQKDDLDPVQLHFTKESKKNALENAYNLAWTCLANSSKTQPDKQLIFLLADTIRQYGELCFNENYFTAKQILSVAMNLQFYALGILSKPIDLTQFYSLEDLKIQASSKKHLFDFMDDILATTAQEQVLAAAFSDCLVRAAPQQRLFMLADTARFLGFSYQHIDSYTKMTFQNECLQKQVFGLSESLLLLIDSERSHQELGNLYFATWPLLYKPVDRDSEKEPLTLYEKTIAHCDTPEMRARVANKQFLEELAADKIENAQKLIDEALALASDMPPDNFNPFLLSSIHNNYAAFFLKPQNFNIKEAEIYIKKATEFASQARQAGEDRLYFAVYDEVMAEIRYLLGDFGGAHLYIESALATLAKYPESNGALLLKIKTLKSIVDKRM